MKRITSLLLAVLTFSFSDSVNMVDNVYQFEEKSISGEVIPLQSYEGKVMLIVNTASECGYTPQYKGLQTLYDEYKDDGLVILGFPANNFGGQEPGSDEEIAEFCELNYGVTFPLFTKVSVKGEDIHPLFNYLTEEENPDFTGEVGWNFEKFLVDKNGNLIRRFKSQVTPDSEELVTAVKELL